MITNSKYRFAVVALALTFSAFGAKAAYSLEELQALKQQIFSEQATLQSIQQEIANNRQQIQTQANQRYFFQRKSQAEKDLIAKNLQDQKKSDDFQADIQARYSALRNRASDYIAQGDATYANMLVVVARLAPVVAQSESTVKKLKTALSEVTSSQFSAGMNATTAGLNAFSGSKPSGLEKVSQALTQMAVSNALSDSKDGINSAIALNEQLKELTRANKSGLFSGTWSGALERGLIFTLLTDGKNPLESNGFNFSTSMFQLSDLSQAKASVKSALGAIEPVSIQMGNELTSLRSKIESTLSDFLQEL